MKGFSYRFSVKPNGFPIHLRRSINVRCALFSDREYHYPTESEKLPF